MPRSSWYDHTTETSPLLTAMAELRSECCRAESVMPYAKSPSSLLANEEIKAAIDRWAECETGHRAFFYCRGHSAPAASTPDNS